MRSLGPIEDRLVVALRYDILNGSRDERAILASQIDEAIDELRRLRRLAGEEATPADEYRRRLQKEFEAANKDCPDCGDRDCGEITCPRWQERLARYLGAR